MASIKKLLWVFIIGVVCFSILPNLFSGYWLLEVFSNFKLQYAVISIVLLICSLLVFQKKSLALIILSMSLLWNAYYILPYYLTNTTKVDIKKELKLSSVNLWSGNNETDLVKKYILEEDPDVLILMELTPGWEAQLNTMIIAYEYKELVARTDNFGIAVLSKFPMKSSVEYFAESTKPSIVADLKIENEKLTLVASHPVPPLGQAAFESRNQQLLSIIKNRDRFSKHLVIAGDFNTSSFSNHFRKLTSGDLKDSRIGFGLLPTWPEDSPILQTTLDHMLVSDSLKVIERSTESSIGSDHLPISTKIGIP
ncbi:endonuclease/exonuclease/phosphatase family protein [Psychroflexus tropicus]|uniref:endonuclease/exonuclease/phosphatase family protein n=1 Tax=Psychroflexus tropicus TaxID=197345 RepID=UPI0012FA6FB8|nr:endonuclease/exonuclease/phosphatase family protein [Psychroflexus tropicus]